MSCSKALAVMQKAVSDHDYVSGKTVLAQFIRRQNNTAEVGIPCHVMGYDPASAGNRKELRMLHENHKEIQNNKNHSEVHAFPTNRDKDRETSPCTVYPALCNVSIISDGIMSALKRNFKSQPR